MFWDCSQTCPYGWDHRYCSYPNHNGGMMEALLRARDEAQWRGCGQFQCDSSPFQGQTCQALHKSWVSHASWDLGSTPASLSEKPSGSGHLSLFSSRQSMGLLTLLKLYFRPQWMAWTLSWPTIFPELLLLPLSWHLLQLPNFSGLALK